MVTVSKRPRPPLNETQALTKPIEAALNKLPGVRVRRNNVGVLEDKRGVPVRYGLGTGSADLVGVVLMHGRLCDATLDGPMAVAKPIGRAFCLEVKKPGVEPEDDQLKWLATVRRLGGFAAVVHSIDEALACVERCRAGEAQ